MKNKNISSFSLEGPENLGSCPERKLWAAVVWRSVCDLFICPEGNDNKKEAEHWLFFDERNSDCVGSLKYCCSILGIDVNHVREIASRQMHMLHRKTNRPVCSQIMENEGAGGRFCQKQYDKKR